MEYSEAVKKIHETYGLDIFKKPFLTHAILSDYVGNAIYDYRLVNVLYLCLSNIEVISIFQKDGLILGREHLKAEYLNFIKDKCSKKEFVDALNPISSLLYPLEYQNTNKPINKGNAVVIKKKVSPKKKSIHQPVLVQNNPVVKQNVKTTPKTFKKVHLKVNALGFTLTPTNGKKTKLLLDNVDTKLDLNNYIKNGLFSVSLNYPNKIVEIEIPYKKYDEIAIKASNSWVYLIDHHDSGNLAKELKIKTDRGDICVVTCVDYISTSSNQGNASIFGKYKKVDTVVNQGKVEYEFNVISLKQLNVTTRVNQGNIVARFYGNKCQPRLTGLFNRPRVVNAITYNGKTKISFDMKTNFGHISIK